MALSADGLASALQEGLEQTVNQYTTAADGTVTTTQVTYRPPIASMRAFAEALIDYITDNAEVEVDGGRVRVVASSGVGVQGTALPGTIS